MRNSGNVAEVDYREFTPPEALRRHVQCVWVLRAPPAPGQIQTIFPDGRCELVVHFGRPPKAWHPERGWHAQPAHLFVAQHRTAVRLAATGELDCLGVRLQPAASAAAGPASLARLRDRIVNLSELAPHLVRPLVEAAEQFRRDCESAKLWRTLERHVASYPIDERIETAVEYIEARHGQVRIESVAAKSGLSLRSLQVKFLQQVGLGAKELARLLRLQATLRSLDAGTQSLSTVATEAGFSDQAHATRELSRITGTTPAQLRAALQKDRDAEDSIRLAAAFVRGRG